MTSYVSGIQCALYDCHSAYNKNTVGNEKSFFSFPKDPIRCALWVKNCNPVSLPTVDTSDLSKKYKLCSLHFENNMFSNFQKNRLYPHAVPTLFETIIMGRICAASFCCNKSTNTKGTTSFFRFPKNVADRNKWASLVGRNDLINTSSKTIQSLCSDHFDNSCISQKSLGRLRLVSGAMPNPVKVVTNDSMDPIPISHFVHNDHDYQKRPDLIKLTNEAAPSIVICPANVKQKEDVTMGSDLKFFEKPVNKFYNRLTDHTYVKLIEPPPFKEISSVECIDPSRYMVQTLNESENIVDEQCVLDSSKSSEPGNIPSSENTENSCLEVIKTVKRHPRRNWKKVALARSNTINDLQEKVIGLQTKIKKKNIKLEKLRFYKLQYMMSQLQQSRQENNIGQRNVDG